jgi:phage tail-like protein
MFELPPVGYYFKVEFLSIGGLLSAALPSVKMDMRFQKVSGFRVNMSPESVKEGGQNLFTHRLPNPYEYGNLVLERGLTRLSMLNVDFQEAMSIFRFNTGNAFVTLLDEKDDPVVAWLFMKTYPVSWSSSDLNADENKIVIDTLELAYTRYQRISL